MKRCNSIDIHIHSTSLDLQDESYFLQRLAYILNRCIDSGLNVRKRMPMRDAATFAVALTNLENARQKAGWSSLDTHEKGQRTVQNHQQN